jgi:hypothetical protein
MGGGEQHTHGTLVFEQCIRSSLCADLPLPQVFSKGEKHLLVTFPFLLQCLYLTCCELHVHAPHVLQQWHF